MAVGKFSDMPWKGTMISMTLFFIMIVAVIVPSIIWTLFVLFFMTAPTADDVTKKYSDAYGFWVRGNSSFFAPGIMSRTDYNETSPTYLHWTPPPGL